MAMKVTQMLLNAQSIDGNVRKQAEERLKQFQEQNLLSFMLSMSWELANDDKPIDSRKLAGFAKSNFSNNMELDYVMRIVCEATLSLEVKMRQAAFECLVSISSMYYKKLAPYMQDIFNIRAKVVREDEEPVLLQAIEFWSSICDEEIDILEE
ncbi:hypothetical protein GH714_011771 [Hevea brasiliensis]|uniref:Uncharacterized protein n=1 Tax=Hevea brasiliensis TaxID=3981 RepID=A0A6A6N827_HEVBR|nr:hypothetical protein GH714_011771 [Hevea brasiliensis]